MAMIARDVVLVYPDFHEEFVIYTDASKRQLGVVITQNSRPIAFFSRKLELLSIVETLKEWQLLIKEYSPEIIYIKGIDSTVADAISRLDYNPDLNHHADDEDMSEEEKWNNLLTLLNHYQSKDNDEQNNNYKQNYSQ
eukprot:7854555-Ditylum_brightwellii.AAC.1